MSDPIQGFLNNPKVERKLIGIVALSFENYSGNKSASFTPEGHCYELNEWYALSKYDNDKVLKMPSGKNGGEKASRSRGYYK